MKGSLRLWGGFFPFLFLHPSLLTSATIGHSWMRDLKYWRLNLGESRGPLSSIESVSWRHQIRTQMYSGPTEVNLGRARLPSLLVFVVLMSSESQTYHRLRSR